jgi:hypothetical protein
MSLIRRSQLGLLFLAMGVGLFAIPAVAQGSPLPAQIRIKFRRDTSPSQRANIVANGLATTTATEDWELVKLQGGATVEQAIARYRTNRYIQEVEQVPSDGGHATGNVAAFGLRLAANAGIRLLSANPMRGQEGFRLELAIPKSAYVDLCVFDVRGTLVRRIVDRSLAAGFHPVAWDATNESGTPVGSGIYFVRMRAGEKVVTERVAVAR